METTEETPKKKGRPDWVPGMKSPNPKGRPKGIEDRRTRIRQQLEADAPAVAQRLSNWHWPAMYRHVGWFRIESFRH
ncbi:hypothetical protein [Nitrosomonas sp.]|uniref:hypothetical protein n=1 Tax=Nitrosomonas sp. TaxID=42353 RepID=UPI0037C91160